MELIREGAIGVKVSKGKVVRCAKSAVRGALVSDRGAAAMEEGIVGIRDRRTLSR